MAFQLTADRLVRTDEDLVFFNQPASPEGGVRLTAPDGLTLDLAAVPAVIETIAITVALADDQPGSLAGTSIPSGSTPTPRPAMPASDPG